MTEIFDMEKEKWYSITRNFRSNLVLQEQNYCRVLKSLSNGDFIFVDGKVERFVLLEPKTPPHCFQSLKHQEKENK